MNVIYRNVNNANALFIKSPSKHNYKNTVNVFTVFPLRVDDKILLLRVYDNVLRVLINR